MPRRRGRDAGSVHQDWSCRSVCGVCRRAGGEGSVSSTAFQTHTDARARTPNAAWRPSSWSIRKRVTSAAPSAAGTHGRVWRRTVVRSEVSPLLSSSVSPPTRHTSERRGPRSDEPYRWIRSIVACEMVTGTEPEPACSRITRAGGACPRSSVPARGTRAGGGQNDSLSGFGAHHDIPQVSSLVRMVGSWSQSGARGAHTLHGRGRRRSARERRPAHVPP